MSSAASEDVPTSSDVGNVPVAPKRYRLFDSIRSAVLILGSAAIVFTAARNSLTWHAQRFWGASGDFWQSQWEIIYDFFDGDELILGFYLVIGVSVASFWLFNILFLCLDLFRWPRFLLQYKIQENVYVTPRQVCRAAIRALLNQVFVAAPLAYIGFHAMRWRGCSTKAADLPTFQWVVWELFVFIWVEEFGFYYAHRLFHHPRVYKYVHKVHHEFTAPIGIASIYAHPLEMLVANCLPLLLGPFVCGSHVATAMLWYTVAMFSTTVAHCGYHLPFFPSPEAHDWHHLKFNQNFGMLGVLDRLHGTDALFRQSKAFERHVLLLSLTPIRQIVPDTPKTIAGKNKQYQD